MTLPRLWISFSLAILVIAPHNATFGEPGPHAGKGWAVDAVASAARALDASKDEDRAEAVLSLVAAQITALQLAEVERTLQQELKRYTSTTKRLDPADPGLRHVLLIRINLYSALADTQLKQGKFEMATRNYNIAIQTAKMGISSQSPEVKHLRTGLACTTARLSVPEAAESIFEQLLAASERASGYVQGDIAMILDNWIEFRGQCGRLSECEAMATRQVEVVKRVYGSDHPQVAESLNRLASIYYANGALERALPLLERALAVRKAAFGSDHPITKRARKNLGMLRDELP